MTLSTTLRLLAQARACEPRYRHLCEALGGAKKYGCDTVITLERILCLNGVDDALWALRAVPEDQRADRDKLARLFACDCAQEVLPIYERLVPGDDRPRKAVETARAFALGAATSEELAAARAAARAAEDAAWADGAAARDAQANLLRAYLR